MCGAVNDGSSLTISGTKQQPAASPAARRSSGGDPEAEPEPRQERVGCLDGWGFGRCYPAAPTPSPAPSPAPIPPQPGRPAVTVSDIARFAPASIRAHTEPGDIAVAGLPANFVAAAEPHTVTGTLFGAPLSVRFTPTFYDYTYGDGTTATLTTPGYSWATLGQAQFTPTPTSHVYERRGVFFADVDIHYDAEVDLGAGWTPVTGDIVTDGPPQSIRVLEARTALVAHTCTERRDAPGC
ncbi:hypothetical protein [Microbacterium sp. CR_7]|uniref:hypothetical protein n=1 Tax=Microbacterium sp. CR_7 TaxID=3055792 RepID=UPI0035C14A17